MEDPQRGDQGAPTQVDVPIPRAAASTKSSGSNSEAKAQLESGNNQEAEASGSSETRRSVSAKAGLGRIQLRLFRVFSLLPGGISKAPSNTFVIHAVRTVDPLVGDLFVCPQTLEAICLNRMLGLQLEFSWERFPSASPPWEASAPSRFAWLSLSARATPLPAAVHPRTGVALSGNRLLDALRNSCAERPWRRASLVAASAAAGPAKEKTLRHDDSTSHSSASDQPLCVRTYEGRNPAAVEHATKFATTRLVQQAVQAALRFYMWHDDATFLGFTKPMYQNSLGVAYGTYYCWSMRRSFVDVSAPRGTSRVSSDDLARPFPSVITAASPQDAATLEELLVLDGLRGAVRVVEQLLEGRAFLGGTEACALDATVFAHLAVLFSIPLPDRRPLQALLSNRAALLQYCHRVQMQYNVWPAGPSWLFGVLSLSESAAGLPLRVHSWRQRSGLPGPGGSDDQQESGSAWNTYQVVWWIGAAVCCAALLVVAGKTPLPIGVTSGPRRRRRSREIRSEHNEAGADEPSGIMLWLPPTMSSSATTVFRLLVFLFLPILTSCSHSTELGTGIPNAPQATLKNVYEEGVRLPTAAPSDAVGFAEQAGSSQSDVPNPFLFNALCESSSIPPDVPQSPTREENIGELDFMLNDAGLEHATEAIWSTFYDRASTAALQGMEEWSHQFMDLLTQTDASRESGEPPASHKSQLFFLMHMLKGQAAGPEPAGEGSDLKEALLARLKGIAGVVLGGNMIVQPPKEGGEQQREVHPHESESEEQRDASHNTLFPRFFVPIAGSRNPFLLGLFWNLLTAYAGFESYFGREQALLPFFSWPSLLTTLNLQSTYHMDAMCSVKRRRFLPRLLASWGRRQVQPGSRRARRVSSLRVSSHRTLCELSDRLSSSLGELLRVQTATLASAGVPVEPGLPHLQNMLRLHVDTCLPGEGGTVQIPCLFEDSRLAREVRELLRPEDDDVMQTRHKAQADLLKQAFTTISGLGALPSPTECHTKPKSIGARKTLKLLVEPTTHSEATNMSKAQVLERLNMAVATLLTTTSLDSAATYWFAFERRTLRQAAKVFRTNVTRALRAVGLHRISKKLLSSPPTELSAEEMEKVARAVQELGKAPDGMRTSLALYSISPSPARPLEGQATVLSSIQEIFAEHGSRPLFAARESLLTSKIGEGSKILRRLTDTWVFAFLGESEGYPRLKDINFRDSSWVKVLYAHGFTPKFVRKLYFKFTAGILEFQREKNVQMAREALRKKLPAKFFKSLFIPFTFTAHSGALMQTINFHSMKHDKTGRDYERQLSEDRPYFLREGSAAARMDKQLKHWASHGFDPALLESHRDFAAFKQAWEKIDLGGLPLPDLSDWWERLKAIVTQGMKAYLELEKHLEKTNDNVYALAHDTIRSLSVDEGQTLFFTRVAHTEPGGWASRVGAKVKRSLLRLLYRTPSRQHGVWFGVRIDFEKLHGLLDQLKQVIEADSRISFKVNAEEALLREVRAELLTHGAVASRAPPFTTRNIGTLGVRREYASMTDDARAEEFQISSCLDHCEGLWRMALVAMLPSMLRPQMMQQYEKAFGTGWALKKLSDPSLINSRRMVFKSDVALSFFDYSTPKEIRNELKGLESGQGTMFAYYMLFTSRAQQRLGNQYLGLLLRQQAPFMGNMVLDWITVRRRHAISAIISSLVLTFLGAYAVMGFFDILQNLTLSGAPPPFDCVWNPIFQEVACNPVSSGASLNTAWITALEQTFLIGLFTSSAVNFIAVRAALSLVISQVKTLMRAQMCLTSAVMRLFRRGAKAFSRIRDYFEKRRAVKRTMLRRAVFHLKSTTPASDVGDSEAFKEVEGVLDGLVRAGRLIRVQEKQG
ncbi:hypothetical protein Efla_004020 [Eimeria flavescens]